MLAPLQRKVVYLSLSACNNLWSLQGRAKGQVNRQDSGSAELQKNLWCHWNIRKYGAGNIRFPHAKEFLRKWSAIWARALKDLRQHCARPKTLRISAGQHNVYWSRNMLHISATKVQPSSGLVLSTFLQPKNIILCFLNNISLICDKNVTTQNLVFLSYWYRKKRLQMHF